MKTWIRPLLLSVDDEANDCKQAYDGQHGLCVHEKVGVQDEGCVHRGVPIKTGVPGRVPKGSRQMAKQPVCGDGEADRVHGQREAHARAR